MTLIAGAPAAAQDLVVRYDDLNLASPTGQKTLDRRIDAAARSFCGTDAQQTGSRINTGAAKCFRDARAAAREQMAALIEKYSLKGG
jgi:UrcA family protein